MAQSQALRNVFRLRDIVDPCSPEYGAKADGATDDSAALNAAIASGKKVDLLGRTYRANNLVQSTNLQQIVSSQGIARIIKNANGALITCSGDDIELQNISFRGDAAAPTFTGDGVVITGQRPTLNNCGSRWMTGRALKATGGRVKIYGTCDIYATTDATANGWDIEIGESGTATLYHHIQDYYSSQATGGILLTDTGSMTILGGQFGKLKIERGTGPAGVNGGKVLGARILGQTDINESTCVLAANQFGNVAITFGAGTSGIRFDLSNQISSGGTITNNGNANNTIMRDISTGSTNDIRIGDDSSTATVKYTPTSSGRMNPQKDLVIENNQGLRFKQSSGADGVSAVMSSGNQFSISNSVSGGALTLSASGGTGTSDRIQFTISGNTRACVDDTGLHMGTISEPRIAPSRSGTPEAALTAPVGSLVTRTDGGALTTLYVKESGTGNTGWVAK